MRDKISLPDAVKNVAEAIKTTGWCLFLGLVFLGDCVK